MDEFVFFGTEDVSGAQSLDPVHYIENLHRDCIYSLASEKILQDAQRHDNVEVFSFCLARIFCYAHAIQMYEFNKAKRIPMKIDEECDYPTMMKNPTHEFSLEFKKHWKMYKRAQESLQWDELVQSILYIGTYIPRRIVYPQLRKWVYRENAYGRKFVDTLISELLVVSVAVCGHLPQNWKDWIHTQYALAAVRRSGEPLSPKVICRLLGFTQQCPAESVECPSDTKQKQNAQFNTVDTANTVDAQDTASSTHSKCAWSMLDMDLLADVISRPDMYRIQDTKDDDKAYLTDIALDLMVENLVPSRIVDTSQKTQTFHRCDRCVYISAQKLVEYVVDFLKVEKTPSVFAMELFDECVCILNTLSHHRTLFRKSACDYDPYDLDPCPIDFLTDSIEVISTRCGHISLLMHYATFMSSTLFWKTLVKFSKQCRCDIKEFMHMSLQYQSLPFTIVANDRLDLLCALVKSKAIDILNTRQEKHNLLHQAVYTSSYECAQYLYQNYPTLARCHDSTEEHKSLLRVVYNATNHGMFMTVRDEEDRQTHTLWKKGLEFVHSIVGEITPLETSWSDFICDIFNDHSVWHSVVPSMKYLWRILEKENSKEWIQSLCDHILEKFDWSTRNGDVMIYFLCTYSSTVSISPELWRCTLGHASLETAFQLFETVYDRMSKNISCPDSSDVGFSEMSEPEISRIQKYSVRFVPNLRFFCEIIASEYHSKHGNTRLKRLRYEYEYERASQRNQESFYAYMYFCLGWNPTQALMDRHPFLQKWCLLPYREVYDTIPLDIRPLCGGWCLENNSLQLKPNRETIRTLLFIYHLKKGTVLTLHRVDMYIFKYLLSFTCRINAPEFV